MNDLELIIRHQSV